MQLHDSVAMITTKRSRRGSASPASRQSDGRSVGISAAPSARSAPGHRPTPALRPTPGLRPTPAFRTTTGPAARQSSVPAMASRTTWPSGGSSSGSSSGGDQRSGGYAETPDNHALPTSGKAPDLHIAKAFADAIAIGISTGGPAALQKLLPQIPPSIGVPIVIVQHMPRTFTASLARDLDTRCPLKVREAVDGDPLVPGVIYIAPAGYQTKAVRRRGTMVLEVNDDAPVRSCKPSVDYLFRSFAAEFGSKTLGIVMTGMGNDGTEGAKSIRDAGGHVIAQDEASCTIYGMPKAVLEAGRVSQVMSLEELPSAIVRAAKTVITAAESVKG
jgi:chemotaxis response regulator CheB